MSNLYNCDFNDIIKGLNDLSNYSGFKDDIINLLKNAVNLLATQDSYVKALIKNNKDLRRKNSILLRNADTAFQDGLNESREVYKSEVKAEICKEFADKTWKIRLTSGVFRTTFEITINDIGKTIFFTRKEADKTLKEKNNES